MARRSREGWLNARHLLAVFAMGNVEGQQVTAVRTALGLTSACGLRQTVAPQASRSGHSRNLETLDIQIARDVAFMIENLPNRDATGAFLNWRGRDALIIEHVRRLEESYASVEALRWLAIAPTSKAQLHTALEQRHSLPVEAIDALRTTMWGNNTANRIMKARRLRHYVPEGTADVRGRGLLRLIEIEVA
jgi:hypothetical protein